MNGKEEALLRPECFSDGEDIEFRISAKREMQSILQNIAEKGTRVALHHEGMHNFMLTTLIGVSAKGLWIDVGPFPLENKRVTLSRKITVVSAHQQVKVQFATNGIKMASFEGDEAFYADLPDSILRIQRRDYFRLNIPARTPVNCIIPIRPYNPAKPDKPEILCKAPVLDISAGGFSLLCGEHEAELLPKATFRDCLVLLPDSGAMRVNIEVRNNIKITAHDGSARMRVGCQFIHMDNQMRYMLQRYLTSLQCKSLVNPDNPIGVLS